MRTDVFKVVNLFLIILSGTIAWLTYTISETAEARQKQEWEIEKANQKRLFWESIRDAESDTFQQVEELGSLLGEYLGSSGDALNALQDYFKSRSEYKKDIFLAKKAKFVASYMRMRAAIEKINEGYINNVVIYSEVVGSLDIKGWDEYLKQGKEFKEWKTNIIKEMDKTFNYLNKLEKMREVPADIKEQLRGIGKSLGELAFKMVPPSEGGLRMFKQLNMPLGAQIND